MWSIWLPSSVLGTLLLHLKSSSKNDMGLREWKVFFFRDLQSNGSLLRKFSNVKIYLMSLWVGDYVHSSNSLFTSLEV